MGTLHGRQGLEVVVRQEAAAMEAMGRGQEHGRPMPLQLLLVLATIASNNAGLHARAPRMLAARRKGDAAMVAECVESAHAAARAQREKKK